MQRTWLSKGRRKEIAPRLQQGASRDRILNDIREDATKHSDLEFKRHHLVDKKDIGNMKTAFALNDIQKHSDDQTSVRAWLQEWDKSEQNPILFAKFQGDAAPDDVNITKDDFLLVVQNPIQKYMVEKFSRKVICIDATHGTTGYDFLLTSLVVLDEWLNAWLAMMGGRPKRLYCTWHVDRAWQEELRSKVKDTLVAAEIYKMLRTVLQQTDESSFNTFLKHFCKNFQI